MDDKPDSNSGQAVGPRTWHPVSLVAFRFAATYLILFNLQATLMMVRYWLGWTHIAGPLLGAYNKLWQLIVMWAGTNILHPHHRIIYTDWNPADSTFGYASTFCCLVLALLCTTIWSGLDRKRQNYDYLQEWFRLYLRITLAWTLINYGSGKVFNSQFSTPDVHRLTQTVGELSPMQLMWTFMGYSDAYSAFGGWSEVGAAVLLLIPRLTLAGALLTLAVMSNVFALNLCYDVHVKQYSLHLILIAIVLIAPDVSRLVDFFILQRKVLPAARPALFGRRWLNICAFVVPLLFGLLYLGQTLQSAMQWKQTLTTKQPLNGTWEVDEISSDRDSNLLPKGYIWRRLAFDQPYLVYVDYKDPTQQSHFLYYLISSDHTSIRLGQARGNPSMIDQHTDWYWMNDLRLTQPDRHTLILQALSDEYKCRIRLHKIDESQFPLNKRKFRWITNEADYGPVK
jgi:uncharacterized membrane protein YphA (DoxX/SURF4 family)